MALQLNLLIAKDKKLPSFERTLGALGDIPAYMYQALEYGTSQNRLFWENISNGDRPRPHLREMIVRDQAKSFLEKRAFIVDDEAVSTGNEPLAALLVRCGSVQMRVLKSHGGIVPGCGDSLGRIRFYNQRPNIYLDRNQKTKEAKLNLLFLWDFDASFNLKQIWLCCPLRAGQTSDKVVTHWHEPISHPAFTIKTQGQGTQNLRDTEDELEKLLRDDFHEEELIEEA